MKRTDILVIGAGQAGLATSRCMTARGIEHVVLERGRIGERWLSERWDSLRLVTPNWMTRLPGGRYTGRDPDGFMPASAVAGFLGDYAATFRAPVEAGVRVTGVTRRDAFYHVDTDQGSWSTRGVVIATGCFDIPAVPAVASALPGRIRQIVPADYRRPDDLPHGGVLVVGASATGVQLAEEIHRSGRPVVLAVGRHTRLPRRHRGRDIMWWLDRMGVLDERIEEVASPEAARRQPSLQLAGGRSVDLALLQRLGVRLVGRVVGIDGVQIGFAPDLPASVAAADDKLVRLISRCDQWAARHALAGLTSEVEPVLPVCCDPTVTRLDLDAERIRTVVWAIGFRRDYSWLNVSVRGAAGEIVHRGGVTSAPGLYAMGLRFMRRRKSTFIDGAGLDAEEITAHLARYLSAEDRRAA